MSAFTTSWTILLTLLQVQMAALNESTRDMTKRRIWFIDDINASTFKSKNVKDEVHTLQKFGQIYAVFIDQTERINKAFMMQLFIIVTASFPFILQQTYKMCKRLHSDTAGTNVDVHLVLSNVISAVILIELVVPCMAVRGEAEYFVDCLHWNTWNVEDKPALEEMLNFITLQTIHQTVEFSVFGLFPLDGTLLYSVSDRKRSYLFYFYYYYYYIFKNKKMQPGLRHTGLLFHYPVITAFCILAAKMFAAARHTGITRIVVIIF
nr:unnamed protein product [Callosobruchus chinensis]